MSEQMLWTDDFKGPELSPQWVGGHFNRSHEVHMEIGDGLRISFDQGDQYASAGVVTKESIAGDFDAEIMFHVANPAQGTTFELAAILASPPLSSSILSETFSEASRVFNVHGSPPFVSSEFDESDGWRIGWNWGDKQGGWNKDGEWQADNTDNNYGKSTFGATNKPAQGWLKLSRRDGKIWQTYGRNLAIDSWRESGSQETELLSGPIYLRIVAKHWVKHRIGLTVAPANSVIFSNFSLKAF